MSLLRRQTQVLFKRCYSAQANASPSGGNPKGISSFLDRMDALYANQSKQKPVSTQNVDFKMKRSKPHSQQKQKKQGGSKSTNNSNTTTTTTTTTTVKARKSNTTNNTKQHNPRPIRAPKPTVSLNDDVMDLMSSTPSQGKEKLDIHIQPSKRPVSRATTQFHSGGGNNARSKSVPKRSSNANSQQQKKRPLGRKIPAARNKKNFKNRAEESTQPIGTITAEMALESIHRSIISGKPSSKFVQLHPLTSSSLVSEINPLATSAGNRLVGAIQEVSANSKDVHNVVNHIIKGTIDDVTIKADSDNMSAVSAANTLNAQSTIPHSVKLSISNIAAGKASVASLKGSS